MNVPRRGQVISGLGEINRLVHIHLMFILPNLMYLNREKNLNRGAASVAPPVLPPVLAAEAAPNGQ